MYSTLPGVEVNKKLHWTPGEPVSDASPVCVCVWGVWSRMCVYIWQGYTPHIISTISEWSLALSFISFFFTYIRDFKVKHHTHAHAWWTRLWHVFVCAEDQSESGGGASWRSPVSLSSLPGRPRDVTASGREHLRVQQGAATLRDDTLHAYTCVYYIITPQCQSLKFIIAESSFLLHVECFLVLYLDINVCF